VLCHGGIARGSIEAHFCYLVDGTRATQEILKLARARKCDTVVIARKSLSWLGNSFRETLQRNLSAMAGDSRSGSWNKVEGAAQEASQRLAAGWEGTNLPGELSTSSAKDHPAYSPRHFDFRLLDASPTLGMGSCCVLCFLFSVAARDDLSRFFRFGQSILGGFARQCTYSS